MRLMQCSGGGYCCVCLSTFIPPSPGHGSLIALGKLPPNSSPTSSNVGQRIAVHPALGLKGLSGKKHQNKPRLVEVSDYDLRVR